MEGMPFLGDTGNVAARLEAETKRMDCTMIASREAVLTVSPDATGQELSRRHTAWQAGTDGGRLCPVER